MSDYSFLSIKDTIINWYNEFFCNENNVIISKNTDDILIIDFNFDECLAQLTITKANNNPFQFIYFEAIDSQNENQICCFYDNEKTNQREVVIALDEAFKFCLNYKLVNNK